MWDYISPPDFSAASTANRPVHAMFAAWQLLQYTEEEKHGHGRLEMGGDGYWKEQGHGCRNRNCSVEPSKASWNVLEGPSARFADIWSLKSITYYRRTWYTFEIDIRGCIQKVEWVFFVVYLKVCVYGMSGCHATGWLSLLWTSDVWLCARDKREINHLPRKRLQGIVWSYRLRVRVSDLAADGPPFIWIPEGQ